MSSQTFRSDFACRPERTRASRRAFPGARVVRTNGSTFTRHRSDVIELKKNDTRWRRTPTIRSYPIPTDSATHGLEGGKNLVQTVGKVVDVSLSHSLQHLLSYFLDVQGRKVHLPAVDVAH